MTKLTKVEVQDAHKEMWIAMCQQEASWKGDKPAFVESWHNYTDSLCKGGYITTNQYNNWSVPPMPKRIPSGV